MKNKNLENLLKLIAENPDLPVIPFVDGEVVCEEGNRRWMGIIGYADINEYCIFEDRYFFEDDIEDLIDSLMYKYNYYEEQAKADAKRMDWQKAICVCIDLPEV